MSLPILKLSSESVDLLAEAIPLGLALGQAGLEGRFPVKHRALGGHRRPIERNLQDLRVVLEAVSIGAPLAIHPFADRSLRDTERHFHLFTGAIKAVHLRPPDQIRPVLIGPPAFLGARHVCIVTDCLALCQRGLCLSGLTVTTGVAYPP